MNEVRNMNECPDIASAFMELLVRNSTAHSVLWPILPTAYNTKKLGLLQKK